MKRLTFTLLAIGILAAASPAMADGADEDLERQRVQATDDDEAADEPDEDIERQRVRTTDDDEAADDGDEVVAEDEQPDEPDFEEPTADDDDVATEPTVAEPAGNHPILAVAPRIGVTAPQPFGDLNSWPVFGADVGVILPFDVGPMQRPLQLGIDASYTQPGATGTGDHPMLGEEGADYNWELTQRMLTLQLTTMWRFMPPGQGFGAHAIIGPRLYLMESIMEADGNDADFGENRETNSEWGLVFGGGVEFELGPGSLVGTLLVGGSPLDQRITGEANTGAINLDVGYRMFF